MNPSLKKLASMASPLEDSATRKMLKMKLVDASTENRVLEWKSTGLFGDSVTKRIKYRTVKAIISFANTEGGFVVFGVSDDGAWKGLKDEEIKEFDMSKIEELVNSSVTPAIKRFGLCEMKHIRKKFIVLHIPPSDLLPHITTKEIYDQSSGKAQMLLGKHYLYCRYGGKSDIAKPADYQRIALRRAELLRNEMLRRFQEVTVNKCEDAAFSEANERVVVRTIVTSDDSSLPSIRLSRDKNITQGPFYHEVLSDSLFEEINNVVDANKLLVQSHKKFIFGEEVYYRIYSEREHVIYEKDIFALLARTGCRFYAPHFYWITKLKPSEIAKIIIDLATNLRKPNVYILMRLAILLGSDAVDWMCQMLDNKWSGQTQAPAYYFSLKEWASDVSKRDGIYVALKRNEKSIIDLPFSQKQEKIKDVISSHLGANELSFACLDLFKNGTNNKDLCRRLDLITYGQRVTEMSDNIKKYLPI